MIHQERLQASVAKLTDERARVSALIQGLTPEQADFQPEATAWSINQIGQHIGLAERGVAAIVKNLFQGGRNQGVYNVRYDELALGIKGIPSGVTRIGFELMSPFSFMARAIPKQLAPFLIANPIFKVKAAPQAEPRQKMGRDEVLVFLAEVRRSTLQLLESVKDRNLERFHWLHPVLGQQDLFGMLELIASHDQRHILQMEAAKKNSRFPV
jgi:hypothetical protein